jgi:hypothetical protein
MRVFVASNLETRYPYKLQKPSTVSTPVRDTCDKFILDSGIGDDVSNAAVLDIAHKYDADFVIAKDYLHRQEATTDSVHEFFDLYESHACSATPLVPLQPPHDEHYTELSGHTHYVLGGLSVETMSTVDAVSHIRRAARVIPDTAHTHALGVGGGIEFLQRVAGNGWIDSIDCATPEMAAMFGKVLDERLRQKTVRIADGDGVAKRNTPLANFNSWQIHDAWQRAEQRHDGDTLSAYQ